MEFPWENWLEDNKTSTLVSSYTRTNPNLIKEEKKNSQKRSQISNLSMQKLQPLDCSKSLGLSSGIIKDFQISASTSLNDFHLPFHARLGKIIGESYGGWCPFKDDGNQYLQVDLGIKSVITGIVL